MNSHSKLHPKSTDPQIMTVCGPIPIPTSGTIDAHNHTWIEPIHGTEPGPVLDQPEQILAELCDYAQAGGTGIIDCQPGDCGRNGVMQRALMEKSGVFIVAATGYHLPRYYPESAQIWRMEEQQFYRYLLAELQVSLSETQDMLNPVRAGFIKVACQETLEQTPEALLRAAASVCRETDCAIEVHTEKGADMQNIAAYFQKLGVQMDRLVLCHVDKRPDFALHRELAQEGVMLEYDTFFRQKYHPEENVWPLLEKMISAGFVENLALATDMAEAESWKFLGGGPGLAALVEIILPRLKSIGLQSEEIEAVTGLNIARRIARPL